MKRVSELMHAYDALPMPTQILLTGGLIILGFIVCWSKGLSFKKQEEF